MKYHKNLDKLVNEITEKEMVSAFTRIGKVFYDEPSLYFFTANLSDKPSYYAKNGYTLHNHISSCGGAGLSFSSEHIAILKSLAEAVERFSGMIYRKEDIWYGRYEDIQKEALNPAEFGKPVDGKVFGWVKGFNLTAGEKPCLIPAQLVLLNNIRPEETVLTVRTSTGTASGFDRDAVLLRGIYEAIERDCFMTFFYNKIPLKKICAESVRDDAVQHIVQTCRRYRLEPHLFDMTNDLGIPAYLTVLTDKTGYGPAVTAGMKAGLHTFRTIEDSIQEAFISRFKMRYEVYSKNISMFHTGPGSIHTHIDRGLYWYPASRLSDLKWLLEQPCTDLKAGQKKLSAKKQLGFLLDRMKEKQFTVYYYDLTLPNFRDIGFYTMKAVIPSLQPLHIDEDDKLLVEKRLSEAARFFGKRDTIINTLPHFF